MLVNGVWTKAWEPVQKQDADGRFIRQDSAFRHWVTPDGSPGPTGRGGFQAEAGRYHLYVGYICPWACRTLMARALKGLETVIGVTVVNPHLTKPTCGSSSPWYASTPPITGCSNATATHCNRCPICTRT